MYSHISGVETEIAKHLTSVIRYDFSLAKTLIAHRVPRASVERAIKLLGILLNITFSTYPTSWIRSEAHQAQARILSAFAVLS